MCIDEDLLAIICCPETHQDLSTISVEQLGILNEAQNEGTLFHRSGNSVNYNLSGGLMTQDRTVVYPIREGIPVLLSEEAIIINEELRLEFAKDS
tara:strand:- start:99 stop:383 length:285 start_codon:yes stop_codon:yes gene_type:complete